MLLQIEKLNNQVLRFIVALVKEQLCYYLFKLIKIDD